MKDIKSVMIGFLLATSMFLFMGQTKATNSEQGKYQGFADGLGSGYIIDTHTGELFRAFKIHQIKKFMREGSWEQIIPPYDFKKINDK